MARLTHGLAGGTAGALGSIGSAAAWGGILARPAGLWVTTQIG